MCVVTTALQVSAIVAALPRKNKRHRHTCQPSHSSPPRLAGQPSSLPRKTNGKDSWGRRTQDAENHNTLLSRHHCSSRPPRSSGCRRHI